MSNEFVRFGFFFFILESFSTFHTLNADFSRTSLLSAHKALAPPDASLNCLSLSVFLCCLKELLPLPSYGISELEASGKTVVSDVFWQLGEIIRSTVFYTKARCKLLELLKEQRTLNCRCDLSSVAQCQQENIIEALFFCYSIIPFDLQIIKIMFWFCFHPYVGMKMFCF